MKWFDKHHSPPAGGGGLADERGGDARGKFWIKPLKETDLGVAQATPKRDHVRKQTNIYFHISSRATLSQTFTAKYNGVLPRAS